MAAGLSETPPHYLSFPTKYFYSYSLPTGEKVKQYFDPYNSIYRLAKTPLSTYFFESNVLLPDSRVEQFYKR